MQTSLFRRDETWNGFRFLYVFIDDLDRHVNLVIKSEYWFVQTWVFGRIGLFLLWGPEQLKGVLILGYRTVLIWGLQTSLAPPFSPSGHRTTLRRHRQVPLICRNPNSKGSCGKAWNWCLSMNGLCRLRRARKWGWSARQRKGCRCRMWGCEWYFILIGIKADASRSTASCTVSLVLK